MSREKEERNIYYSMEVELRKSFVFFVLHEHPHIENLSKILQIYMKSLHADSLVKVSSIPVLFISFQSAGSFQQHSVRSKLYPLEAASCKCKDSLCFASQNDVKEWDKFSCYITKEVLIQMITFITIISVCLVYIKSCKVCHKQNLGPNTVMILKRFVFHRNNNKNSQSNKSEEHTQIQIQKASV